MQQSPQGATTDKHMQRRGFASGLNPSDAYALGKAIGAWTQYRIGSESIVAVEEEGLEYVPEELVRGMTETGMKMLVLGACPLPMLHFFSKKIGVAVAIMLTTTSDEAPPSPTPAAPVSGMIVLNHQGKLPQQVINTWEKMAMSMPRHPAKTRESTGLAGFFMAGNGIPAYVGKLIHAVQNRQGLVVRGKQDGGVHWVLPAPGAQAVVQEIYHQLDLPPPVFVSSAPGQMCRSDAQGDKGLAKEVMPRPFLFASMDKLGCKATICDSAGVELAPLQILVLLWAGRQLAWRRAVRVPPSFAPQPVDEQTAEQHHPVTQDGEAENTGRLPGQGTAQRSQELVHALEQLALANDLVFTHFPDGNVMLAEPDGQGSDGGHVSNLPSSSNESPPSTSSAKQRTPPPKTWRVWATPEGHVVFDDSMHDQSAPASERLQHLGQAMCWQHGEHGGDGYITVLSLASAVAALWQSKVFYEKSASAIVMMA